MKLRCERTNHFGSLCGCLHTEHFIQWLKRLNKLLHKKKKTLCKCSQLIIYLTLDWNPLRNIAVRWHHDSAVHYQTQAHAAASAHKPLSTVLGPAHHKEILRKIRPSPLCLRSVTGQTLFFFSRKRRNLHYTRELTWLWRLNCSGNTRENCSDKTAAWRSSTQSCSGNVTHRPWTFPRPCVVFIVNVLCPTFLISLRAVTYFHLHTWTCSIQHNWTPVLSVSTWICLFLVNLFPSTTSELQLSPGICLNKGEPANWEKKQWIAWLMHTNMHNT